MKRKYSEIKTVFLSGITLVFVLILVIFTVLLVRIKLLQNANRFGMTLAESYALEEEVRLEGYESILVLASKYVEEMIEQKSGKEEIKTWMQSYITKVTQENQEGNVVPYAIIDGEILSVSDYDNLDTYDYRGKSWYQDAVQAEGQTVTSGVRRNEISGNMVYTISKALSHGEDVLALDVSIDSYSLHRTMQYLPKSTFFYLCDEEGRLIDYYILEGLQIQKESLQEHVDELIVGIREGELLAYDAFVTDLVGGERGIYYAEMSNGWNVILTIPVSDILYGDENIVIMILMAVGAILFLSVFIMVFRNLLFHRKFAEADRTIHTLADAYYSIFRVNFVDGSYKSLKMYPDIMRQIPKKGDYHQVLEALQQVVREETYEEFLQMYSLESIRQRVAENIRDYGCDYQRKFDGDYKWVNVRTLYDPKMSKEEVILCFKEIDDEKKHQLQNLLVLQDALDTAKKSVAAKSSFFSQMSHDMRTPLNAIIGLSELAHHHVENTVKIKEDLEKIQMAGNQMLNLVNDVLELSKLEAGKQRLEYKPFDMMQLIRELEATFASAAEKDQKQFQIETELVNTQVIGDLFKITQVMNNLLSNALKYSNQGASISVKIKQFQFQNHHKYQFIVSDTGIGMSKKFLEELFEPYARETDFIKGNVGGTGLGLFIVKNLVTQMSGEISVTSELGQGTTFSVTVPLGVVTEQSDTEKEPEEQQEETIDLTGCRVLLAEDNELNREIANEILTMAGCEVVEAKNGKEAVELFQASEPFSFHVILMDMQMPVMDGCDAARAIRSMEREDAKSVPMIAVTANLFAEDIDKTTEAGMNGHIGKPLDIRILYRTLADCIQKGGK